MRRTNSTLLAFLVIATLFHPLSAEESETTIDDPTVAESPAAPVEPYQFDDLNLLSRVFHAHTAEEGYLLLENELLVRIEEINTIFPLTGEERSSLQLSGKGDIERVRRAFSVVYEKHQQLKKNGDPGRAGLNEIIQNDQPNLTTMVETLFERPQSMFRATIESQLPPDAVEKYRTAMKERRQFEWTTMAMAVICTIDDEVPMTDEQKSRLLELVQLDNPPTLNRGFRSWWFYAKLGHVQDAELQAILTEKQWDRFKMHLQYRGRNGLPAEYFDWDSSDKATRDYNSKHNGEQTDEVAE